MGTRLDIAERALAVGVGMTSDDIAEIFTDDAVVWSPILYSTSLDELAETFADRDLAFANHVVAIRSIEQVGNRVYIEWQLEADHVDAYVLTDDDVIEATGNHVVVGVASVLEFRDGKVASARSYFDSMAFLEQILG